MAVPYLQVDNLTKSFGDLVLFENISFGIAEGQRVGLIAKNGSGKTTLLNIIAGKEGYDSGNIVFPVSARRLSKLTISRFINIKVTTAIIWRNVRNASKLKAWK